MATELQHVGVLGMRWGRRKGLSKLLGKRNRKAIGKKVVNALMTPVFSKKKFTEMSPDSKKRVAYATGVALASVGALIVLSDNMLI